MATKKPLAPTSQLAQTDIASTPRRITNAERDKTFRDTMQQAKVHMNPAQRLFSNIIHVKAVSIVSDFIGGTLARPTSLLSGSIVAILATLTMYGIARYFGYTLSGSESAAAFVIGWLGGSIVDYVQILLRGGRLKNKRS